MSIAINALAPILFLISIGTLLKRTNFFEPSLWPALEKLSYYVLMPILLIHVLSSKQIDNMPWREIALAVNIPVLSVAALFWLSKNFFPRLSGESFTSIFQGGVRFNTFVGLSLAQGLFGADGVVIGAVGSGFMIVVINLLCITTFSLTLKTQGGVLKTLGLQIIKNPLIMGCVIGLSLNMLQITVPTALATSFDVLSRASLPIALITVGAALQFSSLVKNRGVSTLVGIVQFGVKPLIAGLCCYAFGLNGVTAATLILFLATPTAPSSYILSRQLGGDHEMMATLITQQTLFAFLSIPLTIWVLGQVIPLP